VLKKGQFKNAVKMNNIEKYFGHTAALKGVNFGVGANEVVGLIGDNGAGKSTLIKIITGVFPPTKGELYIRDKKVSLRKNRIYGEIFLLAGKLPIVLALLRFVKKKKLPKKLCLI